MHRLYLDNNSTTPMLPEVVEAMARVGVGNPASAHRTGAAARLALETARAGIAQCLGAHADEVVFTSGATESNNLALFGLVKAADQSRSTVVVSQIEHPSIIEPCRESERIGTRLIDLPVDARGRVESLLPILKQVADGNESQKCVVTLQLANHETGVVQDIATLRREVPDLHFHTDATQAVGKVPVHFYQLGVSTLACSAHKFHGPTGIGVLLVNRCVKLAPRTFGGHQQNGLRPGTEPVALAVGMAKALQLAVEQMELRHNHCRTLRQLFLEHLQQRVGPVVVNGDPEHGLPHTLNIAFPGCASELLFIRLDLAGIDCSTGSACSSGSLLPSPVLRAMNVPGEVLSSSMRFSLSHLLSEEEVVDAAQRIGNEVVALRKTS